MCLRILKHGDPVGNQRIVGLFSIISISIKLIVSLNLQVMFFFL